MLLSKLPSGMRYYLGAEARLRRSVEDTAMSVFEGSVDSFRRLLRAVRTGDGSDGGPVQLSPDR